MKFRQKDLTNFLKDFHISRELPYNQYPPPKTYGFAGVTAGLSIITNVNPADDSKDFNSLFASVGLFGQFDSFSGPFFVRVGITGYRGLLYYDWQDNSITNRIVYNEEKIDVSIINPKMNLGFNLANFGNFRPYLSSGIGYYGYTRFKNNIVKETLNTLNDVVYVTLSEEDEKPAGFAGINLEAGTSYNFRSGSRIQFGVSYNHFINRHGYLKCGTGISVSYYHKLY